MTSRAFSAFPDDPAPAPPHPSDLVAAHLAHAARQIAVVPSDPYGQQWAEALRDLLAGHPDPAVRRALAASGPLSVARRLVNDPDVGVRVALTRNPFIIDADLQLALAGDSSVRVVLALLDAVDPYVLACEVIISGPHVRARRRLARKPLRSALLELLAADTDPETRRRAGRQLRQRRLAATAASVAA